MRIVKRNEIKRDDITLYVYIFGDCADGKSMFIVMKNTSCEWFVYDLMR